jgi:predicted tellurium resistance membrane protein TerC
MFEWVSDPAIWASLATLTVMEIVLGIDNVVFISVIVGRLPPEHAKRVRQIGLLGALGFRVLFLLLLTWLIGLDRPLFNAFGRDVSWRDLILLAGGLFLVVKATLEIHKGVEGEGEARPAGAGRMAFGMIVGQIILIDIVFSVDSIITAIGMADHVGVMIAAVVIAMGVMYLASGAIATFIHKHPTTKMLALAFLFMIGAALIADALGHHIERGYIYAAMAFSAFVEILNVLAKRNQTRRTPQRAPGDPQH